MRVRAPARPEALPRPAAAGADDERRPFEPETWSLASSATSSGVSDCVVSDAGSPVCSSAPQREQKFAASGFWKPHSRAVHLRHAVGRVFPVRICGQPVDVDLVEDALAAGHLQPRDELRAQDVDLAVEQAALVADLVLLRLEVVDQRLQLALRE